MLFKPGPVQRDIVQSASARRLHFVRLGHDSTCEKLWCVDGFRSAGVPPAPFHNIKLGLCRPLLHRDKQDAGAARLWNWAARYGMKTETFIRRSRIEAPAAEVYAWHALPGALERLTPPGEHVKMIEKTGGIERGARVVIQFGRWPFRQRWVAEHRDFEEGRYFSDVQVSGPFAYWKHTHTFGPDGPSACVLEDRVEYALPFGVLGRWTAGWYVRRKLKKLFEYRHEVTAREV